jgi:hypothetical protein
MLKRLLFITMMAMSFFAASNSMAHDPVPECGGPKNPCPFVK